MFVYEKEVPPSEEVRLYEQDYEWILEINWRDRALARFRDYRLSRR